MFEDFVDSLHQLVERKLSDINTNTPGTVVSYDAARNRAVVKIAIPKRLATEEGLEGPKIVEVPVVWPASGGGSASFTMPLQPGDGVMLSFQQRSIENWLNGESTFPDDPRQFDLSDCVAMPGLASKGTVAHDKNVVLKFGEMAVNLTPDNSMSVGSGKGSVNIDKDGNIAHNTPNMSVTDKLTLAHDPGAAMEATTKQYNDATNTFMREQLMLEIDDLRHTVFHLIERIEKLEKR